MKYIKQQEMRNLELPLSTILKKISLIQVIIVNCASPGNIRDVLQTNYLQNISSISVYLLTTGSG